MINLPLIVAIPIVFILAVISGLFSATETSFLSVSKSQLQRLIKQGHVKAKRVHNLLKHIEKIIGTVLVCNSLINTLIATLTTAIFIDIFGENGLLYASAFSSVIIIVYVEVLPKLLAINQPLRVAMFLSRFIQEIERTLRPISQSVEFVAKASLRALGISVAQNAHFTSSVDELRGAIDLHHKNDSSRAMLHSILDLQEVEVERIMTHRQNIVMIDAAMPTAEILDLIVTSPYTRFPVWQNNPDNIIGILHAKNFLRTLQQNYKDISCINIIEVVAKAWFITSTTNLYQQLHAFREQKEHFALVVDEYGSFLGIVTLEDIVEEIVGDINDEVDTHLSGTWTGPKGEVYAVGSMPIRDLNRQFGWELSDEMASTIAGVVIYEAQTIPDVGQIFSIDGFHMKIMRRTRNQITLIKIVRPKLHEVENGDE